MSQDRTVNQEMADRACAALEVFRKKYHDYGPQNIARTGMAGLIARMTDKLERLRSLCQSGDQAAVSESVADTCQDLSNYALMTGIYADGLWPGVPSGKMAPAIPLLPGIEVKLIPEDLLYTSDTEVGGLFAPQRPGDVGYDLAVARAGSIPPTHRVDGMIRYIPTGVRILCPADCWAEVRGRSSTTSKLGLTVVTGVIDTGFTGELKVGLINHTASAKTVEAGARIAQIILHRSVVRDLKRVDKLPVTERGEAGFGSTGHK